MYIWGSEPSPVLSSYRFALLFFIFVFLEFSTSEGFEIRAQYPYNQFNGSANSGLGFKRDGHTTNRAENEGFQTPIHISNSGANRDGQDRDPLTFTNTQASSWRWPTGM